MSEKRTGLIRLCTSPIIGRFWLISIVLRVKRNKKKMRN